MLSQSPHLPGSARICLSWTKSSVGHEEQSAQKTGHRGVQRDPEPSPYTAGDTSSPSTLPKHANGITLTMPPLQPKLSSRQPSQERALFSELGQRCEHMPPVPNAVIHSEEIENSRILDHATMLRPPLSWTPHRVVRDISGVTWLAGRHAMTSGRPPGRLPSYSTSWRLFCSSTRCRPG